MTIKLEQFEGKINVWTDKFELKIRMVNACAWIGFEMEAKRTKMDDKFRSNVVRNGAAEL